MRNIQDDSIKRLTEVKEGQVVIPVPEGIIREPGNMLVFGDDIIFPYTVETSEGQYLHYSLGNVNDLTQWKQMGRLPIFKDKFARQVYAKLEDPFIEYNEDEKQIRIYSEDKDKAGHSIVLWYVYKQNWDYHTNTMFGNTIWDGGQTTFESVNPEGGVYSYMSCYDNKYHNWVESRETAYYGKMDIISGLNRKKVLSFDDKCNVPVPDSIYKVKDQYIIACHGCTYHPNAYWYAFTAITNDLFDTWKYLNVVKLPNGAFEWIPLYTDKWHYFYNSPEGIRLGGSSGEIEPPIEEPDDDLDLPEPQAGVPYNVVLMREAKPLIYGLTIPTEQEPDRKRIIDLIDEIA